MRWIKQGCAQCGALEIEVHMLPVVFFFLPEMRLVLVALGKTVHDRRHQSKTPIHKRDFSDQRKLFFFFVLCLFWQTWQTAMCIDCMWVRGLWCGSATNDASTLAGYWAMMLQCSFWTMSFSEEDCFISFDLLSLFASRMHTLSECPHGKNVLSVITGLGHPSVWQNNIRHVSCKRLIEVIDSLFCLWLWTLISPCWIIHAPWVSQVQRWIGHSLMWTEQKQTNKNKMTG